MPLRGANRAQPAPGAPRRTDHGPNTYAKGSGGAADSIDLLAGLLEQQTSLQPVEIMADTAGASGVVFGLFWRLGYQYSPRLADIGGTRF